MTQIKLEPTQSSDENWGKPPSPGSYFWPLLVVVAFCAGYVWYARMRRRDANFELRDVLSYRPAGMGHSEGVRLSVDDMPSRTEFLSNNASTDSLPENVELPVFHSRPSPPNEWSQASNHPASHPTSASGHADPLAATMPYTDQPVAAGSKAGRMLGLGGGMKAPNLSFGRRSTRRKSPIEGDSDSELDGSDDEATIGEGSAVFGIGDDEEPS